LRGSFLRLYDTGKLETVTTSPPLVAIVDDEESVCRALQRLLRSAGFVVATFGSGVDFLKYLESNRPDCLVLDLHMPRMSGFDVQARILERGDRLPVVVITGHDTPETRTRAMDGGAAAYLRKPADDQALLEAVSAAITDGKD
jgi:FixJ family two-component response regulator